MGEPEHVEPSCSFKAAVTFFLGLLFGTFSALTCKMAYDAQSVGLPEEGEAVGLEKAFDKPIMMLLLMFLAMVPALFMFLVQQWLRRPEEREAVPRSLLIALIVPCICDLICTVLLLEAQLYITASMWQMLRGTVIIITAILKRVVLAKQLQAHMWSGVVIIAAAMALTALTSFLDPESQGSGKDPRIGVCLVLLGCLAQGVQYVFEEKVMSNDNAPPLVVIGMEGLWGTLLTVLIVYPLAYTVPGDDHGSMEDPMDAIEMMKNSRELQLLVLIFVVTVTGYNCAAVYVTAYLNSIWHAILDNFRPVTIWMCDLAIFYVILPGSGFGEVWGKYSFIQVLGLLTLFLGTAVYNGNLRWPVGRHGYEPIADGETPMTPRDMSSPALARSPLLRGPVPKPPQDGGLAADMRRKPKYNEV